MTDSPAIDALDFSLLAFEQAGWRGVELPDETAENPPQVLFDVILDAAKTIIDDTGTLRPSWLVTPQAEKDQLEQRVRELCSGELAFSLAVQLSKLTSSISF